MKKQNLGTLIAGAVFLVLLSGVVGMILVRSGRRIRLDQNPHNPVDNIASVSQQPKEAEGIILGKVADQPVEVIKLQLIREGDRAGNLVIEIENKSEKPVTFVKYWLLPMPCRQYDVFNLPIEYGVERSATKKPVNIDAKLDAHQTTSLEVESTKVKRYLNPSGPASMECRPNDPWEKPALSLRLVRFADASVWDITTQPRASNP